MLELNSFDDVKQLLKEKGEDIDALEALFNTSIDIALGNFRDAKEAQAYLNLSNKDLTISRRTEFQEDTGTGKGLSPVNIWKKECRYCKAVFETPNRKKIYCYSPGHKQRYSERKKSANLYLQIIKTLGINTSSKG